MLKKRLSKIAFVLVCVLTLLMPYATPVLAAALKSTDTTAELQVFLMHEGGDDIPLPIFTVFDILFVLHAPDMEITPSFRHYY